MYYSSGGFSSGGETKYSKLLCFFVVIKVQLAFFDNIIDHGLEVLEQVIRSHMSAIRNKKRTES
ncbi:hypothetical protein BC941DRAFT_511502, partial [Chlamydoabsidia padenii]